MTIPLTIKSREECAALARQLTEVVQTLAPTGKVTNVSIRSRTISSLRWARNRPLLSSDVYMFYCILNFSLPDNRDIGFNINTLDEATIRDEVKRALEAVELIPRMERLIVQVGPQRYAPVHMVSSDALQIDMGARSVIGRSMATMCRERRLLSAGHLTIIPEAEYMTNARGLEAYNPSTQCQYSVTVRDEAGTASGWAGKSHTDWTQIDVEAINARAIQKCVDSVNPIAIEPGRYSVVLEPEAAGQLMEVAVSGAAGISNDRTMAHFGFPPYGRPPKGPEKIGDRMIDPRLSVVSDPTDPDAQYIPFYYDGARLRRIVWFENGILRNLKYNADACGAFGDTEPLYPPRLAALRIINSGEHTTLTDMIKSTTRGVLVTRFSSLRLLDQISASMTGETQDGVWLIENGKVTHPVKNFFFTTSPFFAFNSVDAIGTPERIYGTQWQTFTTAVVAPPMKVRDFPFLALSDAI